MLAAPALAAEPGLYMRLAKAERVNRADFFLSHPLVDAVIAGFDWGELEPQEGKFNFSAIDRLLAQCNRHKKALVIHIVTYGQTPEQITPEWLYAKGLEKITFNGGGNAKGGEVSVPKVWNEKYLKAYTELIKALAARYDGNPNIWYIVPGIGHIGNINAQPSKGGGVAFRQAGWTPELWKDFALQVVSIYQQNFHKTRLLIMAANKMIDDKKHQDYREDLQLLLKELGERGVSIIGLGLDPDIEKIKQKGVVEQIEPLIPLTGKIQLGLGDDWPLWVPPKMRKQKFLAARDEQGLENEFKYAFGGVDGLPETHISILYVLHQEIGASHPDAQEGQNKLIYLILETARKRLKSQ